MDAGACLTLGPRLHWQVLSCLCCRYYSLEVVQNPIRARMCGFGDKVCSMRAQMLPG